MGKKHLGLFCCLTVFAAAIFGGKEVLRAETHAEYGDIASGKRTFAIHCSHCHGPFGNGNLGPNLTDEATLHGENYEDILRVVTYGVRGKAMRSWSNTLNPTRLRDVAAYVYSLYGSQTEQ